ncbi:unnamed protein product [Microthlaspi erraticum]|uniref:Uncharacterized protein n=1 Tax=Microthlaspi erraticum TaxID=1685480 RepID=A0A6D2JKF6_9BRAS|nr:unnamed protein product [Microthlaspi erraticum]
MLCASSDWSALDPIRFCISPLASHPLPEASPLSQWLVLHPDSSKSISSPFITLMSPSDWFGRFLSLMSSWVSLPDSIRSSWSLSTPSLLFSSWCRCPIGLGLLRLHSVAGCCYMIG